MSEPFDIDATVGGVRLTLRVRPDREVLLTSLATPRSDDPDAEDIPGASETPLVELALAGEGRVRSSQHDRHRHYAASHRLRYRAHRQSAERLEVEQHDPESGAVVTTVVERTGPHSVHVHTEVAAGVADLVVEYVSSLVLGGFHELGGPEHRAVFDRFELSTADNTWAAEYRWTRGTLRERGLVEPGWGPGRTNQRSAVAIGAFGAWSTGSHLPVGVLHDRDTGRSWGWQVENNGPWRAELCDVGIDVSLALSGPTMRQHHWSTRIRPGERFTSVAVGLAVVDAPDADAGFDTALAALTGHRRGLRLPHAATTPVIVNDYMNCLMGDPTAEKLEPLIDRAGELGADYFVIDAGWYADTGGWWTTVGEWQESRRRFPDGLAATLDRVRERGMVPGLWLEPEVMGVDSPAVGELPPEAYLRRSGRAIAENGRYHLDLRHPAARARLDALVDRLVADYGVGYLKLDHNINPGEGTEVDSETLGDGLLGHVRALREWLAGVTRRHPTLLLENCSSGGMRVDYAQLAVTHLQSTSDQENPMLNAAIAAAAPSAVLPEQAAVWSYPQPEHSDALIDFTMTQSTLQRVHLSGRLDLLSPAQVTRVRAALDVHRGLGPFVQRATPFWPLGLPAWDAEWIALGLRDANRAVVALWHRPTGGSWHPDAPAGPLGGWAVEGEYGPDSVLLPVVAEGARVLHPLDQGVQLLPSPAGLLVTVPAHPGTAVLEWDLTNEERE